MWTVRFPRLALQIVLGQINRSLGMTRAAEIAVVPPNEAGAKDDDLWNDICTLQWAGSFHTVSPLNWVDRSQGILRRIAIDTHFKYYDGQPPEIQETIGDNPLVVGRGSAV